MENKVVESYTAGIGESDVSPKLKKQIDSYTTVLMQIMHSKKTRNAVITMLKGGKKDATTADPMVTLPNAAVSINDMAMNLMAGKNIKPDFNVQLASSKYLIGDLIELGYAAKLWPELSEEEINGITEDSFQTVIERGLEDGSIDPIQLQLDTEPLMNKEQKYAGSGLAELKGLPNEPSKEAIMEQYANSKVNKEAAIKAGLNKNKQPMPTTALNSGGVV